MLPWQVSKNYGGQRSIKLSMEINEAKGIASDYLDIGLVSNSCYLFLQLRSSLILNFLKPGGNENHACYRHRSTPSEESQN
ncbi:MAG: hypothetical protein ACUVTR_04045 [Dehalococcoidia bacterium]